MGLFDPPAEAKYPRRWSDMSFEYQGMFAYHIAMMLMFMTGFLPLVYEVAVASGVVLVVAGVSWDRRRRLDWHRPPLTTVDILKALGVFAMTALFAFATSQGFPFANPHFAPWFLAIVGIGVFGVMQQLKVVTFSEAEFVELGKPQAVSVVEVMNSETGEPSWHRPMRAIYYVAFFAVWLSSLGFFYFESRAIQDGAPTPTAFATESITEHGRTVYITKDRAHLVSRLQMAMFIGIPLILVSGFGLQIFARVRLFPGGVWAFGKRLDDDAG